MTVTHKYTASGGGIICSCKWFNGDKLEEAPFMEGALEIEKAEDASN